MNSSYVTYLRSRWDTSEGKIAKGKIVKCFLSDYQKSSDELDLLISKYVDSTLETKLQKGNFNDIPPFCLSDKADRRGILYRGIDLSTSQAFQTMDISYSIFQNCIMTSMNFHAAILAEARFEECDLRESRFSNSSGPDVVFLECNLQDTIWADVLYHGISFKRSNLKGTIIAGADCTGKKQDIITKVYKEQ